MTKTCVAFVVLGIYLFYVKGQEIEVKRCNCYMLGTFETPDGKSLCEVSTGKCSCLKNVVGTNCDKCKDGFFGLLSGKGCTFCGCTKLGSLKQECDDLSGKCFCKRGYTGHKCEKCMNENPIINGKCCECPEVSSLTKICDTKEKCKCKPHTSGQKCDKCDENYYYNKKSGCTQCKPCYNLVKTATENYDQKLETTIESLNATNISALTKEYEEFKSTIKNLKEKISKLKWIEIKTINKELIAAVKNVVSDFDLIEENIKKNLGKRNKVVEKVKAIEGKYNKTNSLLKSGVKLVKNENKLIDKLNNLVLKAKLLNTGLEKRKIKTDEFSKLVEDVQNLGKQTVDLLKSNSADLTDLNKEIERIKNFTTEIKSTKIAVLENLNKAKDLKEDASKLKVNDFNLKISADKNFVDFVEDKVRKLNFSTVDFDVGKFKDKLDKVETYVNYIEDVKKKNMEVIDEFMKIQTQFNMKEIVLKLNDIKNVIDELMKKYKELNEKLNTEVIPNIKQIEANLAKIDELDTDIIEQLKQDLHEEQKKLDEIVKTQESVISQLQQETERYEKFSSRNPLSDFKEKYKEVELVLNEYSNFEKDLKDLILTYEDYITFLKGIPLYNDRLDEVEVEIRMLEEYYEEFEYFQRVIIKLKSEVGEMEKIIDGLPEEKKWCDPEKTIT